MLMHVSSPFDFLPLPSYNITFHYFNYPPLPLLLYNRWAGDSNEWTEYAMNLPGNSARALLGNDFQGPGPQMGPQSQVNCDVLLAYFRITIWRFDRLLKMMVSSI